MASFGGLDTAIIGLEGGCWDEAPKNGPESPDKRGLIGYTLTVIFCCPRTVRTHLFLRKTAHFGRFGLICDNRSPRRPLTKGAAREKPLHCRAVWSEAVGAGTAGAHDAKGGSMAGTGRIYRRGTIYYIAYRWDGREYRESARSSAVADAKRLLVTRLAERRARAGARTFDDLAACYLDDYAVRGLRTLNTAQGRVAHLRATRSCSRGTGDSTIFRIISRTTVTMKSLTTWLSAICYQAREARWLAVSGGLPSVRLFRVVA